jgi:hemolysin III
LQRQATRSLLEPMTKTYVRVPHHLSPKQTPEQERVSAWTHAIGIALGILGLVMLIVAAARSGGARHIVSAAIFGVSMVALFTASTLYHAFPTGRAKEIFHHFDRASIFLLIAGSYTPFMLVTLAGPWGWSVFGVVWGLALLGVTFMIFFRDRFKKWAAWIYLAMGWLIIIAIYPLSQRLARPGMALLVAGGLAYSAGVFFYLNKRYTYHHAVWHGFVMLGSGLHYFAILRWVLPAPLGGLKP